jgi:hypothetical protein
MTTLAEIDLGAADAESDERLGEYFLSTGYVQEALSGKKSTFLGRKGAGKTALFKQLPELYREQGRDELITIPMSPDQYAWGALKEYKEQGILPEQAHTNAWKLTLAITIASELTSRELAWSQNASTAVKTLGQFLRENYGGESVDLKNAATKLLTGLKSFNLSAFGFGVGFSATDGTERLLTPTVIDKLLELVGVCVREVGVIVLLDRLDDSWDGSKESKTLLIGLLRASKELNDRFRTSGDRGLQVISFLRTDIYPLLRFDDKDKHRAFEYSIAWSPDELAQMISRRLPGDLNVEEILDPQKMRQSTAPFAYVVQRTFLRPREVIQFLTEAKERGDPESRFITKDNLKDAEPTYSRWKVDDLKQEFSKAIPDFPDCLESLRQGVHRYESLAELEERVAEKKPKLAEEQGARWIVDQLFDTSAIGVRPKKSGSIKYKSEDNDLELPLEGALYVHPGLRLGLNVTEKRTGTEDDMEEQEAPLSLSEGH